MLEKFQKSQWGYYPKRTDEEIQSMSAEDIIDLASDDGNPNGISIFDCWNQFTIVQKFRLLAFPHLDRITTDSAKLSLGFINTETERRPNFCYHIQADLN